MASVSCSLRWELVAIARSVGAFTCVTSAMPSVHTARVALQLGPVNELAGSSC